MLTLLSRRLRLPSTCDQTVRCISYTRKFRQQSGSDSHSSRPSQQENPFSQHQQPAYSHPSHPPPQYQQPQYQPYDGSYPQYAGPVSTNPGSLIAASPEIAVSRRIEPLQLILGYEVANVYDLKNTYGQPIGYITESGSFLSTLARQFFHSRRPFRAHITDLAGNTLFEIVRPFYFINSRVHVLNAAGEEIGLVQQRWHIWRREYDFYHRGNFFAASSSMIWSWDFEVTNPYGQHLGAINRNFNGFGMFMFTDANAYAVRMHIPSKDEQEALELRAISLAAAVQIDFRHFSRHSGGFGLMNPLFLFGGIFGGHRSDGATMGGTGVGGSADHVARDENGIPSTEGWREDAPEAFADENEDDTSDDRDR